MADIDKAIILYIYSLYDFQQSLFTEETTPNSKQEPCYIEMSIQE